MNCVGDLSIRRESRVLDKIWKKLVEKKVSTQNHFLKQKCLNYKFVKCFENIDYKAFLLPPNCYTQQKSSISVFKKQFGLV